MYDPCPQSSEVYTDKPLTFQTWGLSVANFLWTQTWVIYLWNTSTIAVVHIMHISVANFRWLRTRLYICGIHHTSHGLYDIYYGDVTLGCTVGYLTMKTTYNYVLYLFVNSLAWNEVKFQSIEVTIASHMINKLKFKQAIHERKKSLYLYNNTTRCIWTKKPEIHHNGGRVQFTERKLQPFITILPERFPAVWIKKDICI